jgi:hypothetical protein
VWCTPAGAQPPQAAPDNHAAAPTKEQINEARVRYDRGRELYADGEYKIALIEFERAYAIAPTFQVLYNVGQVNLQLNNYAAAARAFERYLADGGAKVPADRRAQVEGELKSLAARTAHISVSTTPPGAEVTVDDQLIGTSPVRSVLVDTGQHRIVATKQGYESSTKTITLATGDDVSERLALTAKQTSVTYVAPPKGSYTWLGWVGSGVLAAAAVTTGILASTNYQRYKEAHDAPAAPNDPDGKQQAADIKDARDKTQGFFIATIAAGGAAVIVGGITLYLTLKENKAERTETHVGLLPGGLQVAGSF